jgi:hypothetical protein
MSAREGITVHKFCAYSLNYEEIIGRKTTYHIHVHRKPPKYSSWRAAGTSLSLALFRLSQKTGRFFLI